MREGEREGGREKDKKRGKGERLLVSYMSEYAVITTVCDWYGNSTA